MRRSKASRRSAGTLSAGLRRLAAAVGTAARKGGSPRNVVIARNVADDGRTVVAQRQQVIRTADPAGRPSEPGIGPGADRESER